MQHFVFSQVLTKLICVSVLLYPYVILHPLQFHSILYPLFACFERNKLLRNWTKQFSAKTLEFKRHVIVSRTTRQHGCTAQRRSWKAGRGSHAGVGWAVAACDRGMGLWTFYCPVTEKKITSQRYHKPILLSLVLTCLPPVISQNPISKEILLLRMYPVANIFFQSESTSWILLRYL
jgi:hypothetical protein